VAGVRKMKRKKLDEIKAKNIVLFQQVTNVPIDSLKPHPQNANEGDIDMIAESILENGVYRPIVINTRNGFIAAGHHQWLAMRKLGWDQVPVITIDVDERRHKKIMLADNATADRRTYNERLLDELLQSVGDVTGTGYTELEVEDIHTRATEAAREALKNIESGPGAADMAAEALRRARGGQTLDNDDEYDEGVDEGAGGSDDSEFEDLGGKKDKGIEGAGDELAGAFQLKEDMAFDGVGVWGIPRIRTDAGTLATWDDLPENLLAWAGSATKDWPDPTTHWLYNVGIDSVSGMPRDKNGLFSHVIAAFYCHDEYFDPYWWNPSKHTTRLLNSGISTIVMPDFSMHTPGEESRVLSLWSLYRSRWLGRYFQEAGMKLIPEVTWATADEGFLTDYVLPTLPKKLPLLSIQVQTIDPDSPLNAAYVKQLRLILDTVKPKDLLIYHGKQGRRLFDDGLVPFKGRIKFVASRLYALGESAKKREKKTTL